MYDSTNTINFKNTKKTLGIQYANGYKFLALITMIYMSIMLCNAILTNRYIGSNFLYVLGGTFTSPFIFILNDIIAEIYGFKMARSVLFYGFLAQTLFVIVCQFVVIAPSPSFFTGENVYSQILGLSLLRIHLSGFTAYAIAMIINSYIIQKWKFLIKGQYFWLRSMASSTFSEALFSFIAILMMELQSLPMNDIFSLVIVSFLIKVLYTILLAGPAHKLVSYVKNATGIDVYDLPLKFTPYKYQRQEFN